MNQWLRYLFLFYFVSHIPITLMMDLQAIFGEYYPQPLQEIATWYIVTYRDPLMRDLPVWFRSFIWCELFVQLPFFFFATAALINKWNSIRIPGIIYGVHVATTLVPILSEFIFTPFLTETEKLTLVGFYYPYFLIPAMLALYLAYPEPFKRQSKKL
jgi:hypothetical protein